ncbi:hypothetical protein ADUPG1_003524, partial [Aduncisulcus paluster]
MATTFEVNKTISEINERIKK